MSKRAEKAALQRYALKEITSENVKLHDEFQLGYDKCLEDTKLTAEDVSCIIHLADQFGKDYQKIANVFNEDREEDV